MLKSKYLDFNGRQYGTETLHYFLTGGYVFDLSPSVKFKPFAMVKTAFNAPTSFDLSTNFLFNEKFEIGATYRFEDSFGAMVSYGLSPNLRIGYAYDHITSDLKVTTPASHEFMLLFNLNFNKKVSQSSRYF
jgi:type IX secretion system PorP/SprF family membrane protein